MKDTMTVYLYSLGADLLEDEPAHVIGETGWRTLLHVLAIALEDYRYTVDLSEDEAQGLGACALYEVSADRALDFSMALTDLLEPMIGEGVSMFVLRTDGDQARSVALYSHGYRNSERAPYTVSIDDVLEFVAFCARGEGFKLG